MLASRFPQTPRHGAAACLLVARLAAAFHSSCGAASNSSSRPSFLGSKFPAQKGSTGVGNSSSSSMLRTALGQNKAKSPSPSLGGAEAKSGGSSALPRQRFGGGTRVGGQPGFKRPGGSAGSSKPSFGSPSSPRTGNRAPSGSSSAYDAIQQRIQQRLQQVKRKEEGSKDRLPRDEEIQSPMITYITLDGVIEGVRPLSQVLHELDREQFTLMMVDPQKDPPACRVFSRKILYERERQAKKQKKTTTKASKPQTIQLNANIGDHDLEIKMKKTLALLDKGKRVTIVVEKRSLNARRNDRLQELVPLIMGQVEGRCSIVNPPAMDGPTWSVALQGKAKE